MRTYRIKKLAADFMIWVLLAGCTLTLGLCPPVGVALLAIILFVL